jgi:hypothetical protein
MRWNALLPVIVLAVACASFSDDGRAQQKPIVRGHGQTGWGSAAPATQAGGPSEASRANAWRGGAFGFPFDPRGITAPGLGWLPGDPRNWMPMDPWDEARSKFGLDGGGAAQRAGDPYFSHSDANGLETPDSQPAVTVAHGRNNYALPPVVRFCPTRGYYPAVSECPQGWLYFQPEPPR